MCQKPENVIEIVIYLVHINVVVESFFWYRINQTLCYALMKWRSFSCVICMKKNINQEEMTDLDSKLGIQITAAIKKQLRKSTNKKSVKSY